jgi:hypothetical protein
MAHPSLIVILAALAAGLDARAQETIRPGYWEATERVLSPIRTTKVERRCIAAQDVTRFMSCYINHHYSCQCPEQSYAGGQIRYRGICVDHKGAKVGVAGQGTYTADTLHLTADVTFSFEGRASTDARRIGDDCPPAAQKPEPPSRPSPK